ncbi:uncharacterized protein VNE69_03322 [Vairimorpha necatrix]|uniref:Uncharacterized protein n=1 Tax=Vairimorpha necatrix TaxID=6039 RepID=A0AAX4JB22_9MICR
MCTKIPANVSELPKTSENNFNVEEQRSTKRTIALLRQKLLSKKNITAEEEVSTYTDTYNWKFHPYKKLVLTSKRVDNNEPLNLSVQKEKIANKKILENNIQPNKDQTNENIFILRKKLREQIYLWGSSDSYLNVSRTFLHFEDEKDQVPYSKLRTKTSPWICTTSSIFTDLLDPLHKSISKYKIDEKTKTRLLCQLQFCNEIMAYIHSLLPVKEKWLHLNTKLLYSYLRIVDRFPTLFHEMNLFEVFDDFIRLFSKCSKTKDPVYLEIDDLMRKLDERLNIINNGLNDFIETINSLIEICKNTS